MEHTIEFHGRLCRADGRPANPGTYDLLFRLYPASEAPAPIWQDELRDVPIAAGGFYHVILGRGVALRPQMFAEPPCFLAVAVVRGGRAVEELGDRVPLTGATLRLSASLEEVDARLSIVETRKEATAASGDDTLVRKRLSVLRKRLRRLEGGGGVLAVIISRLAALEQRVEALDRDEGRIARLEDELEDLVGPDGDVVDLTERMDALEGLPRRPGVVSPEERLERLERRITALEAGGLRVELPIDGRPPSSSSGPRVRPKA